MSDEKKTVETPESPDTQKAAAVDEMEKATKDSLDSMKEAGNEKSEKIVNEAESKLEKKYAEFREWLTKNTNPEAIKAETEKVKNDTVRILNETREKVMDVTNSPQFKETMQAGGKFLSGTGAMISEGFKYGYDKLMAVPEVKKVADKVDEGVDKLRQNKYLQQGAEAFEKGLADVTESIGNGLRSFFGDDKKSDSNK